MKKNTKTIITNPEIATFKSIPIALFDSMSVLIIILFFHYPTKNYVGKLSTEDGNS